MFIVNLKTIWITGCVLSVYCGRCLPVTPGCRLPQSSNRPPNTIFWITFSSDRPSEKIYFLIHRTPSTLSMMSIFRNMLRIDTASLRHIQVIRMIRSRSQPKSILGAFCNRLRTLCIGYQFRSIQSGINIFHQFRLIIDHL